MVNLTMTGDEVKMARRILGLRGTSMKATKNFWDFIFRGDEDVRLLDSLEKKGHIAVSFPLGLPVPKGQKRHWYLTKQGIQQLKQQIGEFHF